MLRLLRYLLLASSLTSAAMSYAETPIELSFGITPHQSPAELGKHWVPISQYLSQRTGYQIQFKTSKDLPAYLKDVDAGVYDLLYINPYFFTKAQKAAGYSAMAKDGGTPLIGIIVARKDGPKDIKSLHGAKIATHDVAAFMTAYVRYGYLQDNGVQIEPVGVGSLESVYLTVEKGLFPAGISIQRAFGLLDLEKQARFNVLWKSDPLPPFAYAAHPRVAPKVIEQVRQALLAMSENTEGRALLSKVNIKAILPASDKDFDGMRRLKME